MLLDSSIFTQMHLIAVVTNVSCHEVHQRTSRGPASKYAIHGAYNLQPRNYSNLSFDAYTWTGPLVKMTPTVIADSDGDDSDATCSPERAAHLSLTHESPDGTTTHPSGSTDPTFFKSIFNEQRDAAEKHATHREPDNMEGDIMDASSFDNGFQETRSAGIHADKSLWDVPSSPEFEQPSRRAKKQEGISNTRTKITRGLRRRLDDIGYISQEDDTTVKDVSTKSRKKRRVSGADTTSEELALTLPIESEPSFMVAPTALTTSQKELYSSIGGGATAYPGGPLEQRCVNVMSSGTATNINTPRSNEMPGFEVSDIKSPKVTRTKERAGKRLSSPEPITVLTPGSDTKRGAGKDGSTRAAKSKEVIDASDDEAEKQYAPVDVEEDNESDIEEVPPPVQKKKQRGRPKKNDTKEVKEKDSGAKVKKKRGRPKKSEQVVKVDEEEEGIQEAADAVTTVPMDSVKSDMELQTDLKLEHEYPDAPAAKLDANTENTTSMTKQAPQTPGPDTKRDVSVTEAKNKATKTPSTPAGSSGRPLYRVGLSKNTRIAPLLKIIRK